MSRRAFKEFEEDPFFGFSGERFGSFNDFFAHDPFRRLADGTRSLEGASVDRPKHDGSLFGNPFAYTQSLFAGFNRAFRSMNKEMDDLSEGSDGTGYSHHSVMSYSTGKDGTPKFYEATTSNSRAPGGIRETRKTVRDSERELAKMSVGRHIGSRGHVMEKSENTRTKEREEKQDFLGIEQTDLASFEREWRDKTGSLYRPRGGPQLSDGRAKVKALEGQVGAPEAPTRLDKRDKQLSFK